MRTKFQQPAWETHCRRKGRAKVPGDSSPLAQDPRAFCPSHVRALSQPRTSAVPVFILGFPSPSLLTLMSFPSNPSASSYFLSTLPPCPPRSEDPGPGVGAACLETPLPSLRCAADIGHWVPKGLSTPFFLDLAPPTALTKNWNGN